MSEISSGLHGDPYHTGWLFSLQPSEDGERKSLRNAPVYSDSLDES